MQQIQLSDVQGSEPNTADPGSELGLALLDGFCDGVAAARAAGADGEGTTSGWTRGLHDRLSSLSFSLSSPAVAGCR